MRMEEEGTVHCIHVTRDSLDSVVLLSSVPNDETHSVLPLHPPGTELYDPRLS